jgi:hypothetical protein
MTVLRPMSTGQILDRTFSMYRGNFWLFAGIAAVPPAMMLAVQLLSTTVTFAQGGFPMGRIGGFPYHLAVGTMVVGGVGILLAVVAYLVGYAVAQGATVFAVSAVYLGRDASIGESYRYMRGRWIRVCIVELLIFLRVAGIVLVLGLAAVLLMATMAGGIGVVGAGSVPRILFTVILVLLVVVFWLAALAAALVFYARYALAIPACVLEDLMARQSLRRSVFLARGNLGKVLAILLLTLVLGVGVGMALQLPIQLLMMAMLFKGRLGPQMYLSILNELVTFVSGSVVGPIGTIALSLVYYDARVRKEAFDIQLLMESIAFAPALTPISPSPTPEAGPV